MILATAPDGKYALFHADILSTKDGIHREISGYCKADQLDVRVAQVLSALAPR